VASATLRLYFHLGDLGGKIYRLMQQSRTGVLFLEIEMRDSLQLQIKKFLESRLVQDKPILLGYSGGPDSKALLYLLYVCRRFFPVDIHLAHIDHGWREESAKEAAAIQVEADHLGLPLYTHKLDSKDFASKNWEEQGREHRLRFFSELYTRLECQALILGHHADDQAEVVLKRVFEGASLFNLKGLRAASTLLGMQVWRPLLSVSKKEVLRWLREKNLEYFQDPTNFSEAFLRGRMRQELIPQLKKSFGKEISANLCRLSEESAELHTYFSTLNEQLLDRIVKDSSGQSLDVTPFLPLPLLQLKYLVIEWMRNERMTVSRQMVGDVARMLFEGKGKKELRWATGAFQIERRVIRFFK
jgi:tRNA(Ile)-lysidine synthase